MNRKYELKHDSGSKFSSFPISYDKDLDPQQFEAVHAPNGHTLVNAGAGSGKTRVIAYRVARLIELGVSPDRILLVTFTNKAAREMTRKVQDLTNIDHRQFWGGTFHSIGNRILRRDAHLLGYDKHFTIIDPEDAKDLISACVDEKGIRVTDNRFPKSDLLRSIISESINTGVNIPDVIQRKYHQFQHHTESISALAEAYSIRKLKGNLMDYDDLLINWLRLLKQHPTSEKYWCSQFKHILVDEYQDTNLLQANLVDHLASRHRNLMVVGDDAQSIYKWRGANFANIFKFPERYSDAQIFPIEINYRSTPEIVELACSSIKNNKNQFDKNLTAHRKSVGLKPALVPLTDVTQQAQFVATRILELRDEGIPLSKTAILYRAHSNALQVELELKRRNIPYEVRSGIKFFEQAHIKDVAAFLRLVDNPKDELAWKRTLQMLPAVGKATANQLWLRLNGAEDPIQELKFAAAGAHKYSIHLSRFAQLVDQLRIDSRPALQIESVLSSPYNDYLSANYDNADSRIEDIQELANYAEKFDSTETFLADLSLVTAENAKRSLTGVDTLRSDEEEEAPLVLSSIHQAKGLEWRAVFVISASEGNFPSSRSLSEDSGVEEERRLFYVAVTRAEDHLYLCYPLRFRDFKGAETLQRPSRFVTEVPSELFEKWEVSSS